LPHETLETFEAPEGLSEVTFATKVDEGCPYREEGRDEYEVTIGYGPRTPRPLYDHLLRALARANAVPAAAPRLTVGCICSQL
jgi:hypothetical protein